MTREESTILQQKFILSLNPIQVEELRLKLKAAYDSWKAYEQAIENDSPDDIWRETYHNACRLFDVLEEYFKSILPEKEFKSPKMINGVMSEWRALYKKFLFIS